MITPEIKKQIQAELGNKISYTKLDSGLNTIYNVKTPNKEYILKIHTNPQNKIEWFRAEPKIYKLIKENTDIPSPKIIHTNTSNTETENIYYLMQKIEGKNAEEVKHQITQKQLSSILFQTGKILGKIHKKFELNEYGILGYQENELKPVEGSKKWNYTIEGTITSWKEQIKEEWEKPPEITHKKTKIIENLPEHPKPVLTHSDNRYDNLIIKSGKINGFIDWSHSWSSHKLYDLARAEYLMTNWALRTTDKNHNTENLQNQLRKGYKQNNSIPENWQNSNTRKIYRHATTIWLAAGFTNWGEKFPEDKHEKYRKSILRRLEKEKI